MKFIISEIAFLFLWEKKKYQFDHNIGLLEQLFKC